MSKTRIQLADAKRIAEMIIEELKPFCERIEIAGSIRRGKPEVGDIELVAIPKPWIDMIGAPVPLASDHALNYVAYEQRFGKIVKNGNKFKQIEIERIAHDSITLDLFIVTPPAQWGVIFLLRTGPDSYSHRFVTIRREGGTLPSNLIMKDGAIRQNGKIIETPEEQDVYRVAGLPYIEPGART